jgi:hypothetical protein
LDLEARAVSRDADAAKKQFDTILCIFAGLTMPEVYLKSLKHKSLTELNGQLVGIDKFVRQSKPDMYKKFKNRNRKN